MATVTTGQTSADLTDLRAIVLALVSLGAKAKTSDEFETTDILAKAAAMTSALPSGQ